MKTPHKHAMFIKAWADGEVIEVYDGSRGMWVEIIGTPTWTSSQYRVKQEPKPDVVTVRKVYYDSIRNGMAIRLAEHWEVENVRFTFDGETGHLKKVEKI
jgi:hypothetical protein